MATGGGPPWLRRGLAYAGGAWITLLVLIKLWPEFGDRLPRAPLFFLQCSCLFPTADEMRIDYRVQAYSCTTRHFEELDERSYFPIHAEDKESTFYRVGHFYHDDPDVLASLATWLVDAHDARVAAGRDPGDGIPGPIGGVRVLSLRIPLPPLGAHIDPYTRPSLAAVPEDEHHDWYTTPAASRTSRCLAEAETTVTP